MLLRIRNILPQALCGWLMHCLTPSPSYLSYAHHGQLLGGHGPAQPPWTVWD